MAPTHSPEALTPETLCKLDLELCRAVGTVYLLTEITGLSYQKNTFFIEFNTVLCSYLPIKFPR